MECDKKMSFEECELAILRSAVDKIEKQTGKKKKYKTQKLRKLLRLLNHF